MSARKFFTAAARTVLTAGLAFAAFGPTAAPAQNSPDVQSILNAIGGQAPTTPASQQVPPVSNPSQTTIPPSMTSSSGSSAPTLQGQSHLEVLFSQRAGRPLAQFGYDVFGAAGSVSVTQVGALQDNYILGTGDQINVVLRGHENSALTTTVDRDGRIILPELEPIVGAGRTFGEVREDLMQRVAKTMIGTRAYISIGTVRQVAVLVTGEVQSPGLRTLTGLNTALDAILLSGGIKKTGSLRNIVILRGGRRTTLDLYSIIARGGSAPVGALTEGDRIIVPPIGPTVAITGLLKRPGIYELSQGSAGITARALVELAGGIEIAGAKRLTKLDLQSDGRTRMVSLIGDGVIRTGEVLFVDPERSASGGVVTLSGEAAVPGTRALGSTPSISRLIRDADDLTPDSYTLFGVVVRREPKSNFRAIVPFSIERTFEKKEDLKLADNDLVYIFNQAEIAALAEAASADLTGSTAATNPLAALRPGSNQQPGGGQVGSYGQQQPGGTTQPSAQFGQAGSTSTSSGQMPPPPSTQTQSASLAAAMQAAGAAPQAAPASGGSLSTTNAPVVGQAQSQATQSAIIGGAAAPAAGNAKPVSLDQVANNLNVPTLELVNAARDYLVWVGGEVRNPGAYLAVPDTSLASLIAAAGGVQREADLSAVEITSTVINTESGTSRTVRTSYKVTTQDFASISLKPMDSVRLRPVFSDRNGETVTLAGQVRYPGTFDITRGERLSSVLMRAGGLTDEAYPFGTVFTRQSAAIAEADGNQRTARLLEDNIASAATLPSTLINPSGLSYVENIAQALRTAPALGRISVTADPVILATKPELDMLLQAGDTIYIPKRPSSITVTGEVLNNGAFAYKPGLTVRDYIELAGGENSSADDALVFVVLPDGTARPQGESWWAFGGGREIPPGSMVVVPRDPQPFNFTLFMINFSDILSKLAVTAASLAVIHSKP